MEHAGFSSLGNITEFTGICSINKQSKDFMVDAGFGPLQTIVDVFFLILKGKCPVIRPIAPDSKRSVEVLALTNHS